MNIDDSQSPHFNVILANTYKRDLKRLSKSNRDLTPLYEVLNKLARGHIVDVKHRDHELKGDMKGVRACHIGPDWLLLYRKDRENLILLLIRTGTHRDTLGIE